MGISAFCGLLSTLGQFKAPTQDPEGMRKALSERTETSAETFFWEPSRGLLGDYLTGRPVLFEGREQELEDSPRDIYRAFVRLSPEGRIVDVGRVRNLTATKSADEFAVRGRKNVALFATRTEKAPPSLSFLALDGAPRRGNLPFASRLQLGIDAYIETGSSVGLGRSDLFLSNAKVGDSIGVVIEADEAKLHSGGVENRLPLTQLFLPQDAQGKIDTKSDLLLVPRSPEAQPWPHFAANVGRSILGAPAIAWMEGRVFSTWDWLERTEYSLSHSPSPVDSAPLRSKAQTEASMDHLKGATTESSSISWPPDQLKTRAGAPADDGVWRPIRRKVLPNTQEPLFYRTLLHPDPERPYAELHLVAVDMRRLELGMGAGYEDPHPDTGPPGSGQLPNDPELAPRVVATFNGAFKAVHGRYGMKAEGRLLVEPVKGAATVTVDKAGRVGFGTWGEANDEAEAVAFRQNLDPLIADGQLNPHDRRVWGDHLYGTGVAVERSALCLHKSGQILYAWATEATGLSLARGLLEAGCEYAIHLDMNPGHCAFLFNQVTSTRPLTALGETLDPRMRVNPTRFIRWSPKDFFYLALRGKTPSNPGFQWIVAPGTSPPPQSVPAIFIGERKLGALSIAFDRVQAARLSFVAVVGSEETRPPGDTGPNGGPPPEGSIIAWGLGHQSPGARSGLADGTKVVVDLKRNLASLVIENGTLRLLPPSEVLSAQASTQIIQLPILARDGQLAREANELGGTRLRAGLCIDSNGNLLVARMTHDSSAPLAQALLDLGCSLVVEMDRGSHASPLLQRGETDRPPTAGHQQTMLYGRPMIMKPLTYSF